MIRIKKRSFFEIFFPIALIAFIGQGSGIINRVISGNTRWIFFFILFFYLLLNKKLLRSIPPLLLLVLTFYLGWCILTTLWSEVPILSFMKSTMFLLTIMTFVSAGHLWAKKFASSKALNCLCWVVIIGFLAGILGKGYTSSDIDNGVLLYQGLTHNANMFGELMAMSFPLLLWTLYRHWKEPKERWRWGALLGICAFFLVLSGSRSATMMVLIILFLFLLALDFRKKIKILVFSLLTLTFGMLLMASTITSFVLTHVYKTTAHSDLLASRQMPWQISYNHAVKGGWTGGGFGVNIGEEQFDFSGLSASNYGREKANSQLAIIEETGIVGFCSYALLLLIFFTQALRHGQKLKGSEKIVLAIIVGTLLGILVESIFEAWWDAPAAPESVYFWTLFGVALGLMNKGKRGFRYEHAHLEALDRKAVSNTPS